MTRPAAILVPLCIVLSLAACRGADPARPDVAAPAAIDATAPAGAPAAADERGAPLALEGTVYGEGVSLATSVPVSEIIDDIDQYVGQRVRVEGMVTDVCEKRGCWFDIASDREFETLRFKVEEGVIEFPTSIRGQYAVAEGIVVHAGAEDADSHATRRAIEHGSEGGGEGEEEMPAIRLDGIGAVIRERR